jgi:hypothetical protein
MGNPETYFPHIIVVSYRSAAFAAHLTGKLSIRMVAGFAEIVEGERFFGCGGWI